jgi:hypothetical protein
MFRYYPVEEEYLFVSWPYGTPTLTTFRTRVIRTGLGVVKAEQQKKDGTP